MYVCMLGSACTQERKYFYHYVESFYHLFVKIHEIFGRAGACPLSRSAGAVLYILVRPTLPRV